MANRNTQGGSKHKGSKKKSREQQGFVTKDEEFNEHYAQVLKELGCCQMLLLCDDGVQRVGLIRGTMRKGRKTRIFVGDIVLVKEAEQKTQAHIMLKYDRNDVKTLKRSGALSFIKEEIQVKEEDDLDNVNFGDEEQHQRMEEPSQHEITQNQNEIFGSSSTGSSSTTTTPHANCDESDYEQLPYNPNHQQEVDLDFIDKI